MRRLLLLALCLSACGEKATAPPESPKRKPAAASATAPPAPTAEEVAEAEAGRERFLENFKAYESYRATVGAPAGIAEAEGWQYVEVPVMIYGRFRGGKGFGNSGSVTLRRAAGAKSATARERGWHIYTG